MSEVTPADTETPGPENSGEATSMGEIPNFPDELSYLFQVIFFHNLRI